MVGIQPYIDMRDAYLTVVHIIVGIQLYTGLRDAYLTFEHIIVGIQLYTCLMMHILQLCT